MVGLNPRETAHALAAPVGLLGGWFMVSRTTYAYGGELGFKGMAFYYAGRGGALGDAPAEVVASAMTFFPHPLVEQMWREGRAVMEPLDALAAFSESCWRWGRRRLANAPDLERTAELLARVVDSADSAGLPLFAGWRQAPRPADPPARATHLLHVLREFRGGVHGIAVRASGLTPLEAATAGATDYYKPQDVGWTEPLPELTDELRARRRAAEELTDQIAAPAFSELAEDERVELVQLVEAAAGSAKSG